MGGLCEDDYKRLLLSIRRLYEENDLEQLPAVMLDIVRGLISCEHLSFDELSDPHGRTAGTLPIDMSRGVTVGIGLNRENAGFSEHDRAVLEELAPHMACAYHNALRRSRLRRLFNPACQEQSKEALRHLGLTDRESQVLFWLVQGKTTPQIALILSCAPRTIDKHLEHVFAKLNVETRSGAIAATLERIELAP